MIPVLPSREIVSPLGLVRDMELKSLRFLFNLTEIFLSSRSVVILLSPVKFTVSPPDTFVLGSSLVDKFQAEPSLAWLAALLIASATFLAVAKPSSPVTDAAPVFASLLMVARFVDTSTVLPFILVDTKSPVAPFTLNATSPSFKDWLDVVPLSAPREILRATASEELSTLVLVSVSKPTVIV